MLRAINNIKLGKPSIAPEGRLARKEAAWCLPSRLGCWQAVQRQPAVPDLANLTMGHLSRHGISGTFRSSWVEALFQEYQNSKSRAWPSAVWAGLCLTCFVWELFMVIPHCSSRSASVLITLRLSGLLAAMLHLGMFRCWQYSPRRWAWHAQAHWALQSLLLMLVTLSMKDTEVPLTGRVPQAHVGLSKVLQPYDGDQGILALLSVTCLSALLHLSGMPPLHGIGISCFDILGTYIPASIQEERYSLGMFCSTLAMVLLPAGVAVAREAQRRRLFRALLLLSADARRAMLLVNGMLPKHIRAVLEGEPPAVAAPGLQPIAFDAVDRNVERERQEAHERTAQAPYATPSRLTDTQRGPSDGTCSGGGQPVMAPVPSTLSPMSAAGSFFSRAAALMSPGRTTVSVGGLRKEDFHDAEDWLSETAAEEEEDGARLGHNVELLSEASHSPVHPQSSIAFSHEDVAVCFVYVLDLAGISSQNDPLSMVSGLNRLYSEFDRAVESAGAYKLLAIADMYLFMCNAPTPSPAYAKTTVRVAHKLLSIAAHPRHTIGERKLSIKAGIHSGPLAAGMIGTHSRNYHIFGDTVNFASRLCSTSDAGKLQVSAAFMHSWRQQDPSADKQHQVHSRGRVFLKGKGLQETFWVASRMSQGGSEDSSNTGSSVAETQAARRRRQWALRSLSTRCLSNPTQLLHTLQGPRATDKLPLESLTALAANPIATRLKRVLRNSEVHASFTSCDYEHDQQEQMVTVNTEPQHALTGRFLDPMLELLFRKTQAQTVMKHFVHFMVTFQTPAWLLAAVYTLNWAFPHLTQYPRTAEHLGFLIFGYVICIPYLGLIILYKLGNHAKWLLRHCQVIVRCGFWVQLVLGMASITLADITRAELVYATVVVVILQLVAAQTSIDQHYAVPGQAALASFWAGLALASFLQHSSTARELGVCGLTILTTTICSCVGSLQQLHGARQGFLTRLHTNRNKRKSQALLRHMLPSPWHALSIMNGQPVVEHLQHVTMLYSDIVGYTALSSRLSASSLIKLLDQLYRAFDSHLDALGLYKVETIGDAFVVLGGVRQVRGAGIPVNTTSVSMNRFSQAAWGSPSTPQTAHMLQSPATMGLTFDHADSIGHVSMLQQAVMESMQDSQHDGSQGSGSSAHESPAASRHPTEAVALLAAAMLDDIRLIGRAAGFPIEMRIGIHVGSAVGGIIGWSRPRYFVWGFDTVIGNAMESKGVPGQIMLSSAASTVLEQLGASIDSPREVQVQGTVQHTHLLRAVCGKHIERPDGGGAPSAAPLEVATGLQFGRATPPTLAPVPEALVQQQQLPLPAPSGSPGGGDLEDEEQNSHIEVEEWTGLTSSDVLSREGPPALG